MDVLMDVLMKERWRGGGGWESQLRHEPHDDTLVLNMKQ